MKNTFVKTICLFLMLFLFPLTTYADLLVNTLAGVDPPAYGVVSTNFTDDPPFNSPQTAGADDFVISDAGWKITTIRAYGDYSQRFMTMEGPADSINVYILGNSGELPNSTNLSAASIYAAEGLLSYTELDSANGGGDFEITLPGDGMILPPGTYWLVVQANMKLYDNGQWNWTESSLTTNSGTTNGYESAWYQETVQVPFRMITPSGTGCIGAWNKRVTNCSMTRVPDTNPPADRDFAFQIEGDVLTAGVTVTPASLNTVEDGAAKTYAVVLTAPLSSGETVTITPSSGDTSEGAVSGALTFNSSNWDVPQDVTVSPGGSGDGVDGNINYSITNTVTTTNTGGPYDGVTAGTVSVTNQDIDDSTPNAFTFTDQIDVAQNTLITSDSITVAGINFPSAISVTGGEYEINGSDSWSSAASTVNNSNTVRVRHTSSGNYVTQTNTILTIGGVSDTFSSTTMVNPIVLDAPDGGNTGGTITFTASGQVLSNLSSSIAGGNRPAGLGSPYGQIFYTVTSPSGGMVTVGLNFSTALPEAFNLYKVDESGNYTEIPENAGENGFWTKVDAHNISITLRDNGAFDLNDTLGIVDDPIVLGTLASTSIPTMSEWGMIIMALALAFVSFKMIRKNNITAV